MFDDEDKKKSMDADIESGYGSDTASLNPDDLERLKTLEELGVEDPNPEKKVKTEIREFTREPYEFDPIEYQEDELGEIMDIGGKSIFHESNKKNLIPNLSEIFTKIKDSLSSALDSIKNKILSIKDKIRDKTIGRKYDLQKETYKKGMTVDDISDPFDPQRNTDLVDEALGTKDINPDKMEKLERTEKAIAGEIKRTASIKRKASGDLDISAAKIAREGETPEKPPRIPPIPPKSIKGTHFPAGKKTKEDNIYDTLPPQKTEENPYDTLPTRKGKENVIITPPPGSKPTVPPRPDSYPKPSKPAARINSETRDGLLDELDNIIKTTEDLSKKQQPTTPSGPSSAPPPPPGPSSAPPPPTAQPNIQKDQRKNLLSDIQSFSKGGLKKTGAASFKDELAAKLKGERKFDVSEFDKSKQQRHSHDMGNAKQNFVQSVQKAQKGRKAFDIDAFEKTNQQRHSRNMGDNQPNFSNALKKSDRNFEKTSHKEYSRNIEDDLAKQLQKRREKSEPTTKPDSKISNVDTIEQQQGEDKGPER